jgi:hypothetical protein
MATQQQKQNAAFIDAQVPLVKDKDLAQAKSHLKHAKIAHDTSAPVIDKSVHIGQNNHKDLLKEIQQPHHLEHAQVHDTSAPVIDKSVHIKENHHKELLQEIAEPHHLKHAETHDTSSPRIDPNTHIEVSGTVAAQKAIKENVNYVVDNVNYAKDVLVENAKWAKDVVVENVSYAKDKVVEGANTVIGNVQSNVNYAKDVVAENAQYAKERTVEGAQNAKETLKYNTNLAKNVVAQKAEDVKEGYRHYEKERELVNTKSSLKPTETNDKSAPVIQNDVHIKCE